jgi:XTP/dITP diphosphohydrolase
MSLLIATTNSGKIREFRGLLAGKVPVVGPQDPAFRDRPLPQVEENGDTYFENALKKAIAFQKAFQHPVLADDSGLEVDGLNGGPGVLSARFGGVDISWRERWQKLFDALAKSPTEGWRARFRCVLCYYDGKTVPQFFQGVVEGRIHSAPKGDRGFGYDPIFYYPPFAKTFGELDTGEKDGISHRAEAARHFLAWWELDRAQS